ncbi:MAG: GSCFA domain-containing protein [bacterium]|nr:GSCFA domain-containing protein [bacterium]
MKFHLNHKPLLSDDKISHRTPVFLMGSCFTQNIGAALTEHKFKTCINPNGILFNPLSIDNSLRSLIYKLPFDEKQVLERDGIFLSYHHHSSISAASKDELITKINSETNQSSMFLNKAKFLIISFGTAFTYFHKDLSLAVANCHKQDASLFEKRLLKVEEIVDSYTQLISDLHAFNPELKIIFTVSPVKHLRDGIEQNNLSKATLLLSIHQILKKQATCFYFPAFELINDDLRDYRFYEEDLAHPNKLALDYVWKKFSECYFSEATLQLNKLIGKLNRALDHRPIHGSSTEQSKLEEYVDARKTEIKSLFLEIEF